MSEYKPTKNLVSLATATVMVVSQIKIIENALNFVVHCQARSHPENFSMGGVNQSSLCKILEGRASIAHIGLNVVAI